MKILLTGAAGFIGHNLAKHLLQSPEVELLVSLDSLSDYYAPRLKYDRLLDQGLQLPPLDALQTQTPYSGQDARLLFYLQALEAAPALEALFAQYRFDVVLHLAAQPGVRYSLQAPWRYHSSNHDGLLSLLEANRRYPASHLVFASSSSVYGLNQRIPFRESDPTQHPVSLYAATKKANELTAHAYSHLFQMPITGLRFFTVYGPWNRPDMAIALFADRLFRGQPLQVFNHGQMQRDWTYIGDICQSILRLLPLAPGPAEAFDPKNPDPSISSAPFRLLNIGRNKPLALLDFIRALENVTGIEAQLDYQAMQPGDVASTYADSSQLAALTGYQPQTEIEAGIRSFVEWYRGYYGV